MKLSVRNVKETFWKYKRIHTTYVQVHSYIRNTVKIIILNKLHVSVMLDHFPKFI